MKKTPNCPQIHQEGQNWATEDGSGVLERAVQRITATRSNRPTLYTALTLTLTPLKDRLPPPEGEAL